MVAPKRKYPIEFKTRAVDLCLKAILQGWSVRKFCRYAKIARVTMLTWLSSAEYIDRYTHAMQTKALELPVLANEILKRLTGEKETINPKAAQVALRHIEFRIMREIKHLYQPSKLVTHDHKFSELTDKEVEAKYEELRQRMIAPPPGKIIDGELSKD